MNVTVPLPLPLAPEAIWIQLALGTAVQAQLAVTVIVYGPPELESETGCPTGLRVAPEQGPPLELGVAVNVPFAPVPEVYVRGPEKPPLGFAVKVNDPEP